MPTSLHAFLIAYGYLAVFLLVFLQEIGVPTIIPHELTLLLLGCLALRGDFVLVKLALVVISGDAAGTLLLYIVSYYCSGLIKSAVPSWIPLPYGKVTQLKVRAVEKGARFLLVGRLTPFVRAYTSIVAGLLHVKRRQFVAVALLSSVLYSGGLVVTGWIAGHFFHLSF